MAGGGGQSTTVQKADPWDKQKPYLEYAFQQAQNIYKKPGPSYFPDSTVAPFSPETQQAMQMQSDRALNGSPIQDAANNQLVSTMNGDYLYGGQGFNEALSAATNKIMPQINSTFEMAGRSNSGLADVAKTQAIADAFAGQYDQERQNQMRSMLFAPEIANQDFENIDKLSQVGAYKENMAQQQIQDQIDRWNFGQNVSNTKLADYMNLIQGTYGGTTSTSAGGGGNPLAMYGGLGLSALGMLGGLGGGGAAAAGGGGLLGGLGGLLGFLL